MLWVILLLKAGHKDTELLWDGGVVKLKPGQFVTGRNKLSKETNIKPSTIEDILKYLETQQQIRQQKNNKFRIITIVNWEKYQVDDKKSDSKSDNKATTKRQQSDTIKNVKNDKNKERENKFSPPSLGDIKKYCNERNNGVDAEKFINFYEAKGWFIGKNKMKSWEAAVRTWEGRDNGGRAEEEIKIPAYFRNK